MQQCHKLEDPTRRVCQDIERSLGRKGKLRMLEEAKTGGNEHKNVRVSWFQHRLLHLRKMLASHLPTQWCLTGLSPDLFFYESQSFPT